MNDPELLLSQRYTQNIAYLQEVRHSSMHIGLANVFLSSSTAYPQDVGTTPSCSHLWLPMLLLTINVTRRRDDSYGFRL